MLLGISSGSKLSAYGSKNRVKTTFQIASMLPKVGEKLKSGRDAELLEAVCNIAIQLCWAG